MKTGTCQNETGTNRIRFFCNKIKVEILHQDMAKLHRKKCWFEV